MISGKDLQPFPLFNSLGENLRDRIASCLIKVSLPQDALIFERGDPPEKFVLILSGRVKVCCETQDGQEQILSFFEEGESFAEAALFMKGYPATARTMTASELLYMPKKAFQDLLAANPELALRMIVNLSAKQKKFLRVIEDLALRDARGRLCHYLSRIYEQQEREVAGKADAISIPVSQGSLSHLLGITEETLSRTIRSLRKDGILSASGKGRFEILDARRLKEAYAI